MTSRKATFYCSKTTHFVFILYNIRICGIYDIAILAQIRPRRKHNDHIYKVSVAYIVVVVVWSLRTFVNLLFGV